jgi:hypothetical protein
MISERAVGNKGTDILLTRPEPPVDEELVYIEEGESSAAISGTGTRNDPYRVSSASQFDSVLGNRVKRHFRLGRGVFETRGSWALPDYCALPNGGSIIGAGMYETSLCLADDAVFESGGQERQDTNVLWCGTPYRNNGPTDIRDLSIVGNNARFAEDRVIAGLCCWGNGCRIERVRISEIQGNLENEMESFGIAARSGEEGSWMGPDGGTSIRDCIVSDCRPASYVSAIYPGYADFGRQMGLNIIEGCYVDGGDGNHAAYSGNCSCAFRNCSGRGFKTGFYNDTGDVSLWLIDGCDIHCSYAGVMITGVEGSGQRKEDIAVVHSRFIIGPPPNCEAIGMALVDNGHLEWLNISMRHCRVRAVGLARRLVVLSASARAMAGVLVKENMFSAPAVQNLAGPIPHGAVVIRENVLEDGSYVFGGLDQI